MSFEEYKLKLGQDMHDELGQRMVALKFGAAILESNPSADNAKAISRDDLPEARRTVSVGLAEFARHKRFPALRGALADLGFWGTPTHAGASRQRERRHQRGPEQ